MIRVFVRHPVNDFSRWKDVYDGLAGERRDRGVVGDGVFRSAGSPEDVLLWHDFESVENAGAYLESDFLRDAMKDAGVAGEPEIWFAERHEKPEFYGSVRDLRVRLQRDG